MLMRIVFGRLLGDCPMYVKVMGLEVGVVFLRYMHCAAADRPRGISSVSNTLTCCALVIGKRVMLGHMLIVPEQARVDM